MRTSVLLQEAVERAIMTYDPIRTSETEIDIDVQGGDVTLNGYVRTDVMRSVATQLATGVRGVRTVRNYLLSDSDLEIAVGQEIEFRLGTYIVPMMPVVRAVRGHIFLRGPVPSEGAKEIIQEAAQRAPGVVMVHNLLDVDPVALERMIAPKKITATATAGAAAGGQAMVGGKPVTEADLPTWAMKAKSSWSLADYKERAKAKMAFKRGEGPDPSEMEAAGGILRSGAEPDEADAEEAAHTEEAALDRPLEDAEQIANPSAELDEEDIPAATVDLEALKSQFPAWALKPKEEWDKDDFKAQMQAKRAAKAGEGDDPETIIQKAQAALTAAQSGGKKKSAASPKNAREAAIAAVRSRFPGWAITQRKEWGPQEFQEAADARIADLLGKGQPVKVVRAEAQDALEAALRGESVAGGGVATRRDLTPEEVAAVRVGLTDYPAWALKPKEEWDKEDFKAQMQAKRAAKSGEGDDPETIIEKAQSALQAALQAARDALPLEGGNGGAPAAAPAAAAGPKTITPELLEKYPGWALKPKEEWSADEFKAHAKAKSAFKKGAGPDPDALTAEAQAALG